MIGPGSAARRLVRRAIRLSLRIPRLRSVLDAELTALRRDRAARAVEADAGTAASVGPVGIFTDRHGTGHALDPRLRDRLKPSWRTMCDPVAVAAVPDEAALRGRARKAATNATELERALDVAAGVAVTGRILEVGCYDGAAAFELSRRPGARVVASDLSRYYVVQRPGEPEEAAVAEEVRRLAVIRERARVVADVPPDTVTFVEDDITRSGLEPGSFDLIVSFEVLEHVADPPAALAAMARLLRPGGVMYHDYNPFFSAIGGHSLVTLDMPWGHARLDADDVERYLREIRPAEASQAGRFYRDSLNRMTLADLRSALAGAGLEPLAVIPWFDRGLLPQVSRDVLEQVRRSYPSATLDDLLATFVAVVARRAPESVG